MRPPAEKPTTLMPHELLAMAGVGQAEREKEAEDPSELWLAMTQLPRPWKLVDVPRKIPGTGQPVGQVAIWPLTEEEQMACNAEADRFTKRLLQDPQKRDEANLGYAHTYSNETAVQVLYRACRDVKNLKRPAFPSPRLMRAAFTTDEIGVLFNSYCTVQMELGPIVSYMSHEEMEGWIFRLHKGGSLAPFDTLSWEAQKTLVGFLVSRLASCWMDMCSAGLPLDVSTYAESRIQELVQEKRDEEAARAAAEAIPDAPAPSPTVPPPKE